MAGGLPVRPILEEFTCPACGATVTRRNPAWKGIWFTAVAPEAIALCARQHHRHDRRGRPTPPPPVEEPVDTRLPIVARDGDILVTPGVAFRRDGDRYDVIVLDDLDPGRLVGSLAPLLATGRVVGSVAVADVDIDIDQRGIDAGPVAAPLTC